MIINIIRWLIYIVVACLAVFAMGWLGRELFRALLKLTPTRKWELLRIFLILLGIFVGLSIITFNPNDYTSKDPLSFTLSNSIANKGGIIGAIIGIWLCRGMGVSSLVIPIILLLWGILPRKYYPSLTLRTAFLIGVSIFISFMLAGIPYTIFSGGIIGEKLSAAGTRYFGIGKWFIASALVIALCLTFEKIRAIIFSIGKRQKRKKVRDEIIKEREIKEQEINAKEEEMEDDGQEEIEERIDKHVPALDITEFRPLFLDCLKDPDPISESESDTELKEKARVLEQKFEEFGISGKITKIAPGPVITRYEYEPAPGIKVARIAGLSDDIALSMKSTRIRIVAPIPGKGVVGIEVPNQSRENVYLKEILTFPTYENSTSPLAIALGKDIAGDSVCDNIAGFPHLLVAGTTGSGKSVCINTIIASILYRATPQEVRFLMIDPKRLELRLYNGVPHLVRPVISDAKESLEALKETILWMEIRYKEFARVGVRDIEGYNQRASSPKPYILVIIDELADLMMTAPKDIEAILTRLAQMSRAVGIHLILATQRPSVDIITGLIKANFPARLAFQVASKTDSRTILDMNGAEKLLGKGDMLFLPPGKGVAERLHGAYISTQESKRIADLWTERWAAEWLANKIDNPQLIAKELIKEDLVESLVEKDVFPGAIERIDLFAKRLDAEYGIQSHNLRNLLLTLDYYPTLDEEKETIEIEKPTTEEGFTEEGIDELFEEAKALVIRHQTASVSLLQRQFKIGYARAGRLIDELEKAGVIGPYVGSKSRDVLVI
ncbi:MAG: DNA translocase FtsK 4TM domain-containing protein [Candidatus Stahlbacteria bacterium]|nr:DNA translocase FtsK 4TM domain-containing protein [Candidatus Stahlbacteria bacterium]